MDVDNGVDSSEQEDNADASRTGKALDDTHDGDSVMDNGHDDHGGPIPESGVKEDGDIRADEGDDMELADGNKGGIEPPLSKEMDQVPTRDDAQLHNVSSDKPDLAPDADQEPERNDDDGRGLGDGENDGIVQPVGTKVEDEKRHSDRLKGKERLYPTGPQPKPSGGRKRLKRKRDVEQPRAVTEPLAHIKELRQQVSSLSTFLNLNINRQTEAS